MSKMRFLWGVGLAAALALSFGASRASADSWYYSIDTPNSAISAYAGPYGTVQVDLNSTGTTATLTFTALGPYRFGDGGVVDANVNGAYTLGTVTETGTSGGFTPSFKDNVPGNVSTFGNFTLSLNNNDGWGDSATTVSFTITGSWASASSVLVANSDNYSVAAHVFVPSTYPNPGTSSDSAVATGYAANGSGGGPNPPGYVPEPSTLAIAGLGVLGFLGYGIRRRRAK